MSVNKVILIGNLGKTPDVRTLENGNKVARFTLATNEYYTNRETGEKRASTEWHNIVVWRTLAEFSEKYLQKGRKVYIEGKLKSNAWNDKDGVTRYSTDIIADVLTVLDQKETPKNETKEGNFVKNPNNSESELLNEKSDLPF